MYFWSCFFYFKARLLLLEFMKKVPFPTKKGHLPAIYQDFRFWDTLQWLMPILSISQSKRANTDIKKCSPFWKAKQSRPVSYCSTSKTNLKNICSQIRSEKMGNNLVVTSECSLQLCWLYPSFTVETYLDIANFFWSSINSQISMRSG